MNSVTKDYIVGIDLGTTNSVIAIWDNKKNKPQIIKNRDNKSTTPSVVAMAYGGIIVGSTAKNILKEMEEKGEATATHNREMGTEETVLFNGKKQPPYVLASYLLQELKKITEDTLKTKVQRAVITVPVYFPQTGVTDTKKAGEMAGFIVESLLPEPIAAALAYGKRAEEDTQLMVYDLGGGTFDVSIIEVKGGEFIVHVNDGDRYLGGDDFDTLLRNHILDKAQYTYLLENESRNSIILQKLSLLAEDAKINLSTMTSVRILTRGQYTDSQGKTIDVDIKITRDEFIKLIEPKIDDTVRYCKKVLKDAKLTIKDINEIILVGGSTKIPYIAKRLKVEFGIQLTQSLNPMTCVAEGAAIFTRYLQRTLQDKQAKATSKLDFTIVPKREPSLLKKTFHINNYSVVGNPCDFDTRIIISSECQSNLEKKVSEKSNLDKETGGILLGDAFKDETNGQFLVEIHDFIPARYTQATIASLRFTHESWYDMKKREKEEYPGKKRVGWYHTHPFKNIDKYLISIFFSQKDEFIHKEAFKKKWQIALVLGYAGKQKGFYKWNGNTIIPCGGYYISNKDTTDA